MYTDDQPPSSPLSDVPSSHPSSPLSSIVSRSPTPPADYPSPPSSNGQSASNVRKAPDDAATDGERMPAAKRQRITKPKEMKTQYLDLEELNESDSAEYYSAEDDKIKRLKEVLRTKRKIVVIAGAGISVSAGIPDFRSATGLFRTLQEKHKLKSSGKHLFDADVYRNDKSTSAFHDMVRELSEQTKKAEPTPFHHMLATLAEEGRLLRLYTQNVDGLESCLQPLATTVPLNLKGPWPKTIQLHGGLEKMVCTKCGDVSDFQASLFDGPKTPSCQVCQDSEMARKVGGLRTQGVGRLRPRMALYNERNADEDAIGAVCAADLKSKPDAVIIVGTTLKVPGTRRLAKELCSLARDKRCGFTAWINSYDTAPTGIDMKDCFDLVVKGECDTIAGLVGLPRWDDKDSGPYYVIEKGSEKVKSSSLAVIVDLKPQGMLTPTDSPRDQSPAPANLSKLKQQVLSFGFNKVPAIVTKQKKKPGRRPLPSGPLQGSGIKDLFTSTKKQVAQPKKNFKSDDESMPSFPNLVPGPTKRLGRPPKQPTPPISSVQSISSGKISGTSKGPKRPRSENGLDSYSGKKPGGKAPKRPKPTGPVSHFWSTVKVTTTCSVVIDPKTVASPPKTPVHIPSEFSLRRRETISPKSKPNGMESFID